MITRTTQSGFASLMTYNIQKISSQLQDVTVQASTGARIGAPSSAPEDQGLLIRLRAALSDQQTYQDNAESGMSLMDVVDDAFASANTALDRTLELVVQGASETYSSDDRAALAEELQSIRDQLVSVSNTDFAGRYVFAGTAYDAPTFDADGNYQGNSDIPTIRVGEDRYEDSGFDGGAVFSDAFSLLDDIEAALLSDDTDALAQLTADTSAVLSDVSLARGRAGTGFNRFDDARALSENMELAVTTRITEFAGIDETEVYTRLSELQTAYQAALQITSAGMDVSMFDFI